MNTTVDFKTADVLASMGGKLWEKAGLRRVYFRPETVLELAIERYRSGNISSATLAGETISNAEASRALACKFWFDLISGKFVAQGADRLHGPARAQVARFEARLRQAVTDTARR